MMLGLANQLIEQAIEFNLFGSANLEGSAYQRALMDKYLEMNGTTRFDDKELARLKPIIAQRLVRKAMVPLIEYPLECDSDLSVAARTIKRVKHSLAIAKVLASCGSFNCEIGNLVLCLALIGRVEQPLELLTFSGVRDDGRDTAHTFVTLGCPDTDLLGPALLTERNGDEFTAEQLLEFQNYMVCDAYHQEAYPITQGLAVADERLARYDDIEHFEAPAVRRFIYLENPRALYDAHPEIQALCAAVLAAKDDQTLKAETIKRFRDVLLRPFKLATETGLPTPDKALRRAASMGLTQYVKWIVKEFGAEIISMPDDNLAKRNTALHLALTGHHAECAHLLVALGANLDVANANGQTPRQLMAAAVAPAVQAVFHGASVGAAQEESAVEHGT